MKQAIHRLVQAMTQSQQAPPPPPPAPRYSVRQIAVELLCLADAAFDDYAFDRDPLAGRLTPPLRRELGEKARESGRQLARSVRQRMGKATVEEICKAYGARVIRQPQPQHTDQVLYAQFCLPDTITVFEHCLQTAERVGEESQIPVLTRSVLEPILLAHELYHLLESKDKQLFAAQYRLRLWKVGPWKNDSPVHCLSELAAMAFAKELLQLSFFPFALDALLVYGYDAALACDIRDEVMTQ